MRIVALMLAIAGAALAAGGSELPIPFGPIWGNLDTGLVMTSVTAHGGIGYTAPDSTTFGVGFRYPKNLAVSRLYYGGMLCGSDSTFMVDRFYGHPAANLNKDWEIIDSLHRDDWYGGQEYTATMQDIHHTIQSWLVARLHAIALPEPYGNGVILIYDYWNRGLTGVYGLYAGIWTDFDISSGGTADSGCIDTLRRLAFQRATATAFPTCGIAVLAPHQAANLSVVWHMAYVYPTDTCVGEYQKLRWLNGMLHQGNSDTSADWSIVASTGPFDLGLGGPYRTAFAVMGCSSDVHLDRKLDSLQTWYDANVGLEELGVRTPLPTILTLSPNPLTGSTRINFGAPSKSMAWLNLYDRTGKLVDRIWHGRLNGQAMNVSWNGRKFNNGVYFLRLESEQLSKTIKAVITR